MGNISIVYFSKNGNTRLGAKYLNEKLVGNLIELKEEKKGNFIQAILKKGSKLKGNPWKEIEESDQVYLMFPIWASNGTPAMNTFIQNADFKGIKVNIITFQQFEDLRNSDKVHKYVSGLILNKGGEVCSSYAFIGGKMGHCADEKSIKGQIDKISL